MCRNDASSVISRHIILSRVLQEMTIFYNPMSACNLSLSFYLKRELFSSIFRTRNTSRLSVVVEFWLAGSDIIYWRFPARHPKRKKEMCFYWKVLTGCEALIRVCGDRLLWTKTFNWFPSKIYFLKLPFFFHGLFSDASRKQQSSWPRSSFFAHSTVYWFISGDKLCTRNRKTMEGEWQPERKQFQ